MWRLHYHRFQGALYLNPPGRHPIRPIQSNPLIAPRCYIHPYMVYFVFHPSFFLQVYRSSDQTFGIFWHFWLFLFRSRPDRLPPGPPHLPLVSTNINSSIITILCQVFVVCGKMVRIEGGGDGLVASHHQHQPRFLYCHLVTIIWNADREPSILGNEKGNNWLDAQPWGHHITIICIVTIIIA